MRVVQLGPYPPPNGGVQTNLVAIRNFLIRHGIPCDAVNLTRFRRPSADGVYYPNSARELAALLLRLRFDVAHLHIGGDLSPRLLLLALFCSLLPGRKTVLTFHSGGYPDSPAGKSASPRTFRGFVLRRFDALIAVNGALAALFERFGVPQPRIHVISPFSVSVPDPWPEFPAAVAEFFARHRPVLFTMGWLEPEYNFALQIDALGAVLRRYPGAGLLIAGQGRLEPEIRRQLASKAYSDHVLLCGDLPHPVALRAIAESNLFLRITSFDGDSISVREALYLGTAVLATDNGMRPEGVALLPGCDCETLSAAIERQLQAGCAERRPGAGEENLEAVLRLYRGLL